jgi:ELWxxDGT repeat protein
MSLRSRFAFALLLLGVLAPNLLPAQEPYLVREINQHTQSEKGLASHEVLATSSGLFYSFDDGLHGPELWRDDSLVRDLCPGPCGSAPRDFAELGGKIYFFAADGVTGLELWRTDGTLGGTIPMGDFCPGSCSAWPDNGSSLVSVGKAVFFRTRNADSQVGLWTSDGTPSGTRRVDDICPHCNAGIFDLTAVGDSVFFRANDSIHGIEVWSSDGDATTMLRDDCPGDCSSGPAKDQPDLFTPYHDGTYYWQLVAGPAGPAGRWRLRSTAGDPEDHPIELDSSLPPHLEVVGSALFLAAGSVLARIDIPTFTLAVVHDFGVPVGPVVSLGTTVFFPGYDPGHGFELWSSTGSDAQLVADTVPGPDSGEFASLVAVAGKLFFTSRDSLWVSNGTAFGTRRLSEAPSRPVASLTPDPVRGRLLFTTGDFTRSTVDLWATNGSFPYPVRSIKEVAGSADLLSLKVFANTLFFGAREAGRDPRRLWRSDGTAGGTEILFALAAAPEDAAPFQEGLVFRSGTEIWKTDGTAGGTRRILNLFDADHLEVAGDRLFFSGFSSKGRDEFTGFELWSSDGTPDGTRIILDIDPGYDPTPAGPEARSSRPRQLTMVGSTLFFVADTPEEGTELWSSDGATDGTVLHIELCAGPCSTDPHLLASFAGRLFFTAGTGVDLLSTAPGETGVDLRYHWIGRSVPDPVVFQGRLFFFAEDLTGYEDLWSSDGTAPGTVLVREVAGPDQPRTAHEPTVVGDRLYFTSWDKATGQEPWVSDGTAGGTHLLADVRPGPQSSASRHLTAAAEHLFFSADDGTTGQELWITDGMITRRIGDVAPGPGSAAPDDLTAAGDRLFFSADDGQKGRELWALDTTQLYVHCVPAADRLCLGGRRFEVTVTFSNPFAGGVAKPATAIPDSDQSGFFWFFAPGNLELAVKVLDGRSVNGHFWVLFGALSDVEYTVTVKDRATDAVRTYHNPHGSLCGQADTAAFPDPDGATGAIAPSRFVPFDPIPATAAATAGPCTPGPSELCLGGGRFRVEARWQDQHNHTEGTAVAVPRTAESGSFWFFSPGNTELVVKVLDGTPVNGKFWVFYGALSDVEYWLTVTDTVTGAAKTYHNPPGSYCGKGDTAGL